MNVTHTTTLRQQIQNLTPLHELFEKCVCSHIQTRADQLYFALYLGKFVENTKCTSIQISFLKHPANTFQIRVICSVCIEKLNFVYQLMHEAISRAGATNVIYKPRNVHNQIYTMEFGPSLPDPHVLHRELNHFFRSHDTKFTHPILHWKGERFNMSCNISIANKITTAGVRDEEHFNWNCRIINKILGLLKPFREVKFFVSDANRIEREEATKNEMQIINYFPSSPWPCIKSVNRICANVEKSLHKAFSSAPRKIQPNTYPSIAAHMSNYRNIARLYGTAFCSLPQEERLHLISTCNSSNFIADERNDILIESEDDMIDE